MTSFCCLIRFVYSVLIMKDKVEKSVISSLSYQSSGVTFPVKGSDMKKSIQGIMAKVSNNKDQELVEMTNLLEKIKIMPTAIPYMDNDYLDRVNPPKRFDYDTIEGRDAVKAPTEDSGLVVSVNLKVTPTDEQKVMMRKYNQLVDLYIDNCTSLIKMGTLIRHIEEKKVYNLSVDQMSVLGL